MTVHDAAPLPKIAETRWRISREPKMRVRRPAPMVTMTETILMPRGRGSTGPGRVHPRSGTRTRGRRACFLSFGLGLSRRARKITRPEPGVSGYVEGRLRRRGCAAPLRVCLAWEARFRGRRGGRE